MPRYVYATPFVICPPDNLVRQLPGLHHLSERLSFKYADRQQMVTEKELQAMGTALWSALELNTDFDFARQQASADVLSIIIESGAPEVQALPWETLYHPVFGFLGRHPAFTLTRRTKPPQPGARHLEKGPLRVLLFTSLPDGINPETGRLNVEEEQVQVQEALMPWISKGLVKLEMPDDGRFSTLQGLLQSFQPHVLFLSGHGSFHHQPHTGAAPYGVFFFESETGSAEEVREDAIAAALIGTGLQVVVLSACESSKAASSALTNGLAQHISAQGIPHVIGMRESVYDTAGIQFARALCDALARRERIDCALQAARMAIQTPPNGTNRREAGTVIQEEYSRVQWCLPMLLSPDPSRSLIDWDFPTREETARDAGTSLSGLSLPPRFIGRRAEMRLYKSDLLHHRLQKLLITGPGGQGKTALAGKLALYLQAQGWHVFAWSVRPENPWRDFEFELELVLDKNHAAEYNQKQALLTDDTWRARFMLRLLMQQFAGQVVLFLDNLESVQDAGTLEVTDPTIAAWLQEARALPGLILLATSRWLLPAWAGEHLPLTRAGYGDFLQMAQLLAENGKLKKELLGDHGFLRQVYETLGGNSRGLEWFAAATLNMKTAEETAFLAQLAQTKSELQANMAIEAIYAHLPEPARALLHRLPTYTSPVPLEGVIKLALDLPEPSAGLERLLAVSLVEEQYEPDWQVTEYQSSPLVVDWLREKHRIDGNPALLNLAADFHLYVLRNERRTFAQAVAAHHALRRAARNAEADRLTLDAIVGPLTMAGFYATLLKDWLPRICESQDMATRGEALGQVGKLHLHTGDYETALTYLKQSLAIRQQIGDKAGEGTTLNNISQIFKAQGDYETALTYLKQSLAIQQQIGDKAGLCATLFNMGHIYIQNGQIQEAVHSWVTVYLIAKRMNLAQALQALSGLAPQLGLPEGLEGWEMLAQRFQSETEENTEERKTELEQVDEFIHAVIQAARAHSPEAARYFDAVSKMALDPKAPPQYRELGNVLRKYMSGISNPDLSALPKEFAEIVQKALSEEEERLR